MRIKFTLLFFILLGLNAKAQQLPQFTQYMLNKYAYNPAYAGSNPYWDVTSNNRYQWTGITDAPRTFTLSAAGPLKNNKLAMGGYLYTDIVGPTRRLGFQTSFAYILNITEEIRLSFGLSVGFNQWILDADKITTVHEDDFYFGNGLLKSFDPDGKFGLYLFHDNWYFGASIEQIFHDNVSFLATQTSSETYMENHFYFLTGYTFNLSDSWQLEPSALLKINNPAPLKFDANLRVIYDEKFWIGGGYRINDAYTLMAGFMYNDIMQFGYSYDITNTALKNYSFATHELNLSIRFGNSNSQK
jgi:type IX secretion system PorP/SprF family membrane protein